MQAGRFCASMAPEGARPLGDRFKAGSWTAARADACAIVGASGLDQLVANRIAHELRGGANTKLAHRSGSVGFDCLDADIEQTRDLLVAVAFRDQLHDLALARRENGRTGASPGAETVQQRFRSLA